jgi:glycosyltransferase involved in cell wall biosynthesis
VTNRPGWLFVLPWSPEYVGGVNQVVKNLYREFEREQEYRPLLLVPDWSAATARPAGYAGCDSWFLRLRVPPADRSVRLWLRYALSLPGDLWRLARWLRRENIAVVNFHYPSLAAWPVLLLQRLGWFHGRLILSFHGTDVETLADSLPVTEPRWRQLASLPATVVVPSAFLAERLRRHLPWALIRVISNGVASPAPGTLADVTALESWLAQAPAGPYLLHVGKFGSIKGQDLAIRVFAGLTDRYPTLSLLLVGSGEFDDLKALAVSLGVSGKVRFLCDVPHPAVLQLMRRAVCLLSCSRFESFGLVIIEAGLMGTPVVAMAVGGIPELIRDEQNGLLCPPEDVDATRQALVRLLDDKVLACSLAERLGQDARRYYSWSEAYRAYLDVAK